MISAGRRDFPIPLGFVLYALIDINASVRSALIVLRDADARYLALLRQLAVAAVAGFLLIDIARRSRTPWYALPPLLLVSFVGIAFIVDWISSSLVSTIQALVGAAITAAAGRGGSGGLGLAMFGVVAVALLVLATGAALLVTLASRLVSGLPLWTRDSLRDFGTHLAGAMAWLTIAVGGYLSIRFGYRLQWGFSASSVPSWLPLTAALAGTVAATGLYLVFAYRSRRKQSAVPRRPAALAPACAVHSRLPVSAGRVRHHERAHQ
jgi:hypothetical protein